MGRTAIDSRRLRYLAAVLSAYASLIHNWVLPDHFREWWGYGLFFLVAAAMQGFYAGALLFWPRRAVFLAGILGNAAILGLYVVTRTLGIPFFGPHAGEVEQVHASDLVTAMAEFALLIVLVSLFHGLSHGRSPKHQTEERRRC